MRKLLAALTLFAVILLPASIAWGATTESCTTAKVPVTKTIKVTTHPVIHGKLTTKIVKRKVDVRVPKRERVKVKGKWIVKTVEVIKYKTVQTCAPVLASAVPTTTTTPATVAASSVIPVRATIDPDWALDTLTPQDPTIHPVQVTFTYSASTNDPLPDGTLTLNIYSHGSVASAGGCAANVGADQSPTGTSANPVYCTVNIPAWGDYDLVTSYSGGSNVSATEGTETVDIEPPAPGATVIAETWGTDSPSTHPTINTVVSGANGSTTVSDGNFEGATSIALTDQLGDTCTAAISGTSATCAMPLTGQPTNYTLTYPGGMTSQGSQTIAPWGKSQSQAVTYNWAAQLVTVAAPHVTGSYVVYQATISYVLWRVYSGNTIVASGTTPSSPLAVPAGDTLVVAYGGAGNFPGDTGDPAGTLSVTADNTITGSNWYDPNNGTAGSLDCSAITNLGGTAGGGCQITFTGGSGTYHLTTGYVSGDANYASEPNALSLTVSVS